MLGRDLKYLAGVAELSRLDLERDSAALTLEIKDGVAQTRYRGAYSGGWRWLPVTEHSSFCVTVNAGNFLSLVNTLIDDSQATLVPMVKENVLLVQTGESSMRFPGYGAPIDEKDVSPEGRTAAPEFAAALGIDDFTKELSTAINYVAKDQIRPMLTGVKIDVTKTDVRFTAFDGFAVLFKSFIPATTRGEGSMVVPVDYLAGAKLITGDTLFIAKSKGAEVATIQNKDGSAFFRSSLLIGSWPNLSQIENMPNVGDRLTLLADQLHILDVASQSFKMQEVLLHSEGGRTTFQVESDSGSLTSRIAGKVDHDVYYDLTSLAKVARMGERVEVVVPPTVDMPTIARSGNRICWLTARVH